MMREQRSELELNNKKLQNKLLESLLDFNLIMKTLNQLTNKVDQLTTKVDQLTNKVDQLTIVV